MRRRRHPLLEHLEVDKREAEGEQDQHEHDAVDGPLRHVVEEAVVIAALALVRWFAGKPSR